MEAYFCFKAACGQRAKRANMLQFEPPPATWPTRTGDETGPALNPGLSAAYTAAQPLETAGAPVRAAAITAVAEQGAILGARAAGHRLLGGDFDGGGRWRAGRHLELL